MNNYIKTIISGLKQWVSTQITKSKSDWNQSDSSATNYVKNRTHYTDIGEVEVLSKTTYNDRTGITLNTPLITGNTYTVAFNGTVYECIAKRYDDYIMIGNNALYEYDNGDETDTGEPFAIECAINNTSTYVYFSDTITSSPTLRITTMGEVVHKLDKKYLPDMVTSYNDLEDKPTIYTDVVRYNTTQSLSSTQMAKARSNIGAANSSDVTGVLRYTAAQSLTSAQKTQVKNNIGIGNFDGTYYSLTGKPTVYEDVVRYGSQSLSTDQKKQARENIGASNFSGRYSDLTDAPEYAQGYDRLYVTAVHTEGIDIYDDKDGDLTTTPFASWSPTTWHCNPNGQDGSKTSSTTFGFGTRDDDVILQAQYMKSNGTTITSKDIQFTGIATPTADNDVANKAYVDGLVGDTSVSEQISTAIGAIPVVDNYKNGLMTSSDKKKLDTVESNAQKNVQSDWAINDMTSMSFVQNRPFYDGPLSITWDGVTKGHPADMYDSSNYRVKITDTIFTDEELQTARFVINENGTTTEVAVADVWEDRSTTSSLTGIWYNDMPCVYVVRQAGSLVGPGTYFLYNYSSNIYIQSLTVGSDTDVKKIDEKYIPDTIARTSDVNELNTLVGDVAVSEQISEALINNQGDWIQNDSTKADYIKNRPFYTEDPVEESVFASTSLDFDGDDAYFNDFSTSLEVELLQAIVPGVEYVVTFDGTEYRRTAFVDGFRVVIGNAAFIAGEDTGEPFAIDTHGGTYADICVDHDNMSVHTISIVAIKANVHKIDMKYIPNCLIPKKTYVELVENEWIDDGSLLCQVVEIGAVTANSKIDLQPTAYQVLDMQNNDIAFMLENDGGVVTAYCLGGKPNKSYTMQVLITEVVPV